MTETLEQSGSKIAAQPKAAQRDALLFFKAFGFFSFQKDRTPYRMTNLIRHQIKVGIKL
jgi:hypothetical protein